MTNYLLTAGVFMLLIVGVGAYVLTQPATQSTNSDATLGFVPTTLDGGEFNNTYGRETSHSTGFRQTEPVQNSNGTNRRDIAFNTTSIPQQEYSGVSDTLAQKSGQSNGGSNNFGSVVGLGVQNNLKCTSVAGDGIRSTMYIAQTGNDVYMRTEGTAPDGFVVNTIIDPSTELSYTWPFGEDENLGLVSSTKLEEPEIEDVGFAAIPSDAEIEALLEGNNVGIDCTSWKPNLSFFNPPSHVRFVTFDQWVAEISGGF